MIYPQNSIEKLGFEEIKQAIRTYCISEMGVDMVDKIRFMTNFDQIIKFLRQTSEFKTIIETDEALPIQSFYDIKKLSDKAKIEGTFLTEEEFFQIHNSLQTAFAVIKYFEEREGTYPNLEALFEH